MHRPDWISMSLLVFECQWEFFRLFECIEFDINVEGRPMQLVRGELLHLIDLFHGG